MAGKVKSWRRWAPKAAAAGFVVLVVALLAAFVRHMLSTEHVARKQVIRQVMLMKPPPPPPPPKVVEKPPPEKRQEVKVPQPQAKPQPAENKPDNAPPKNLGLDAEGGPGSDSFGLVGNKGGRDIIGGGGGGSRFGWFAGIVQRDVYDALEENKTLRKGDYKVIVKIWLTGEGRIKKVELSGSSGRSDVDAAIRNALLNMKPLSEAPPADLPQPVQLRLTSRQG